MLVPQTVETVYLNTSAHPEWHEGLELIYDLDHVLSSFCGQVGTEHDSETSSVEMGITVMPCQRLGISPWVRMNWLQIRQLSPA